MVRTFLTLPPEDLDWAPCTCTGACSDSLEELHLQRYGLLTHQAPAHHRLLLTMMISVKGGKTPRDVTSMDSI